MSHDTQKLQKLTDFDFSQEGAHVAIVGKAANGKQKFLVTKSLGEDLEKAYSPDMTYEELEQAALSVSTTMPLADLLELQGLWRWDALVIASAINKSEEDIDSKEKLEKFIKGLDLDLEARKGINKNIDSNGEQSMTTESKKVEEDTSKEDIVKSLEAGKSALEAELAEIKKSLEARDKAEAKLKEQVDLLKSQEDARILKAYEDKAEGFTELGLTKADALVLKAVEAVEGGSKILEALTKAQDVLVAKNDPMTDESGHGAEDNSESAYDKLEAIAKNMMDVDSNLSKPEAMNKACAANPALYVKFTTEGVQA